MKWWISFEYSMASFGGVVLNLCELWSSLGEVMLVDTHKQYKVAMGGGVYHDVWSISKKKNSMNIDLS